MFLGACITSLHALSGGDQALMGHWLDIRALARIWRLPWRGWQLCLLKFILFCWLRISPSQYALLCEANPDALLELNASSQLILQP